MQIGRLCSDHLSCRVNHFAGYLRTRSIRYYGTKPAPIAVTSTRTVRCCESLYAKWGELRPHLPAPPYSNLTIPITFTRTSGTSPNATRILAIHGAPGTSEHYRLLGQTLTSAANIDFIAVTFPDAWHTWKQRDFFQTPEEKCSIVEALLKDLGITEVDMVIGHSAGTYAAILLSLGSADIPVHSLALLNSTTARRVPIFEPEWLHGTLIGAVHTPGLRYGVFASYWVVNKALKLRKFTPMDAITAIAAQYFPRNWESAPELFRQLIEKEVPRIAMFGARDRLVPIKWSELMAGDFGNPERRNHFVYAGKTDEEIRLLQSPAGPRSAEIVCFNEGGHNLYDQYPQTVTDHLLRCLKENDLLR